MPRRLACCECDQVHWVFWTQFMGFFKMHLSVKTRRLSIPGSFISNPKGKDVQSRSGQFCLYCLSAVASRRIILEPKEVFNGNRVWNSLKKDYDLVGTTQSCYSVISLQKWGRWFSAWNTAIWPGTYISWICFADAAWESNSFFCPITAFVVSHTVIQVVGMSQECWAKRLIF